MPRKVTKKKKRSCKMCKPNKMGLAPRWDHKELDLLRRTEKEISCFMKPTKGECDE